VPVLPSAFSPAVVSRVALVNAIANGVIVVTGGAVRLTGSGLGCPTWPRCTGSSIVPTPELAGHGVIEFTNRLLTFVLTAAAIATVVVVVRSVRRDLRRLAVISLLGIPAQALLGGVTVLTGLNPWTVAAHFLLSMVLVWLAVLLVAAVTEGDAPPRWYLPGPLRGLLPTATVVLAALLVAGTLVTSAGPHAGDAATPRLAISVAALAQLHADLLVGFLGLLAGLGFALRAMDVPRGTWRRYLVLVCVVLAQGALGAVQYLTGVPEVLVSLHVLGAASVVVAMGALWTGCRARDEAPAATVASTRPLASAGTT
jgi:cytochrome c oxidase assembly protein subunit 15